MHAISFFHSLSSTGKNGAYITTDIPAKKRKLSEVSEPREISMENVTNTLKHVDHESNVNSPSEPQELSSTSEVDSVQKITNAIKTSSFRTLIPRIILEDIFLRNKNKAEANKQSIDIERQVNAENNEVNYCQSKHLNQNSHQNQQIDGNLSKLPTPKSVDNLKGK